MVNPDFAHGQADGSDGLWSLLAAIMSRVRRDLPATPAPLLLLGSAIVVGSIPQVANVGWNAGGLLDGDRFTALLLTAAFGVLWLAYRNRAGRGATGHAAGFGVAAVFGLFLVTVGFALLVYAGPFVLFGAGLLLAAARQRNMLLAWWAVLAGGLGVFEGFFGITNRLPGSVWRTWEHPAIYLALGVLTVLAGLVARLLGNRQQ